jgi:two-component system chemotaxis response regulator CheB
MPEPARVLIVDDSRIFRAALEAALADEAGVRVVGSVFSGEKALEFLQSSPTDVVTLDVEMPGLDGLQTLEAIQRLNAARPPGAEIGVVMVSAFTRRGADVTVRALQAGAFDFITKPSGPCAEACLSALREHLAPRIHLFLARRARGASRESSGGLLPRSTLHAPRSTRAARAVLIATSTGGPRALEALLPELARRIDLPVLVVQHMPPQFTRSLADNLARQSGLPVVEASDGERVRPRGVYLAPGGKHLLLRAFGTGELRTVLNDQPPENGFRPSADVLFRSAAAALGGAVVAVVLTGMACETVADGTAGLGPLKRAGAHVIAQDEATSVVWGMPGSAVRAGLVDEVLPLGAIAAAVQAAAGQGGG